MSRHTHPNTRQHYTVTPNPEAGRLISLAALTLTPVLASAPAAAQPAATYRVEFTAEWSAAAHPAAFPANPHFSPLIGATHTDAASLWSRGGTATPGIEVMAETGATGTLNSEVLQLILDGTADQFINLGGVAVSPGSRGGTVTVSSDFPLFSLVTMIAPSPDWFVGVHDVDLRPNGLWARELAFDLDAYDSGTDAGSSYTSPNSDITPHAPIANIQADFPFNGGPPIGTLRLTLTSPAACSIADLAEPYDTLDLADISTYIEAFTTQSDAADLAAPEGVLDLADITAFVNAFGTGCP